MPMRQYQIRRYRDSDAEHLSALYHKAISRIGPKAYTSEQIAAWLGRHPGPDRYRQRVSAGATILVATNGEDTPVAYALIEPDGHLDHLYNHPDHTRQGLAGKLLATAEGLARSAGSARLYTEASELARPVFERAGYSVTHRRDFEIGGVPIHNYAMEKGLR